MPLLCLFVYLFIWAPRHEGALEEWRYSSTHSLTSALDGDEWSASRPSRFTPRERTHGTHWIGGWVGHRVVLDAVVKRKIPSPRRESNTRTPIVQPVAQRYTDGSWCEHCTKIKLNKTQQNWFTFRQRHFFRKWIDKAFSRVVHANNRPLYIYQKMFKGNNL
jgi:hypothetical protein